MSLENTGNFYHQCLFVNMGTVYHRSIWRIWGLLITNVFWEYGECLSPMSFENMGTVYYQRLLRIWGLFIINVFGKYGDCLSPMSFRVWGLFITLSFYHKAFHNYYTLIWLFFSYPGSRLQPCLTSLHQGNDSDECDIDIIITRFGNGAHEPWSLPVNLYSTKILLVSDSLFLKIPVDPFYALLVTGLRNFRMTLWATV